MTTVAYKNGQMAADRRTDFPYGNTGVTKLKRRGDAIYGGAGYADEIALLADWYFGDRKERPQYATGKNDDPHADLLVMHDDGRVFWVGWACYPREINGDVAIGSGGQYAVGAMAAGASAVEAVMIAAKFDTDTGQGFNVAERGGQVMETQT